jgi:SAM-dependent methyltransferase
MRKSGSTTVTIQAALDLPSGTEPCDPLTIRIEGWVFGGSRHTDIAAVEAVAEADSLLAQTKLLFCRPDVASALAIAPDIPTGFSMLGAAPSLTGAKQMSLGIRVRFRDGSSELVAERAVPLTGCDYRQGDWGVLLDAGFPHLVRREHMYNSGPSQDTPSQELLTLLDRYLPPAPARILDVGCGRGPYAEPLRSRGHDWFGVELKSEDCAVLDAKRLPFRQVDGRALPFSAGAFDAAICIEVLEHVENPWEFIAEVRRVVRGRLIVSVPNLELVTYWRRYLAVPWHLLEADHRNFFSRASLGELLRGHFSSVEVFSYGHAPLRTAEGASVDYHLLAVANV